MEKKIIVLGILCVLLLISGCKETVYKDSKSVSGNTAEFDFTLDTSIPSYDIELQVKYIYELGHRLEKLTGEIISSSGKKYSAWTLLSAKKINQAGSGLKSLHFENVKSEDGTFKLSIQKESGKIILKTATLKVLKGK